MPSANGGKSAEAMWPNSAAGCSTRPNRIGGTVIFVTNEVGLGVVPENAQARRYRDLVGRANQLIAAAADTVTLMSCGIPLPLKEERQHEPAQ